MKKIPLGNKEYFIILGSGINDFEGEKEYYSTSSVKGTKILEPEKIITYEKRPSRANMQPLDGVVCFAKMSQTIKVFKIDNEFAKKSILSTGFSLVLPNKNLIDSNYLKYYFLSNEFNLKKDKLSTGSTQVAINNANIKKIQIPLFSLQTQKKITQEIEKQFSRLDEGLNSLKRIKENLKKYKASVLKSAVEGKLTKTWRESQREIEPASVLLEKILKEKEDKFKKQFPKRKYKKPEEIKKEDIPDIELPEGWCWSRLDMIGEFGRGKSKHRPRNDPKLFGGKYPFLQTGEVTNSNGKITEYTKSYSDFGLSQSKLWPKGTLCITIAANIAYTGFLTFDACFPDSIVGLTTNKNLMNINYIDIFIKNIRQELEKFAPATAQKNINLQILSNIIVPLPPLQEQNQIVKIVEEKLSVVEKLEKIVEENIKRAENLRQSILKKAFEGRLVEVGKNEDEEVEKLLEEIKQEKAKIEKEEKEAKKMARKRK